MLVNESKHQGLVLGDTDYNFSFPVKDMLEIFGMEIDNKLNFSSHISNVCKRINNQFNVMLRFRKYIPRDTLLKLYKAYILPHFYYCSSVWHFCGACNADKLKALNKRILRFILGDYSSPYSSLLTKANSTSLCNKRVQNFLILLYKSLFYLFSCLYEKICFHSSLPLMIFTAIHSVVNLEQLAMALIHFLISQLSCGMHCLILSILVHLQTLGGKSRAVSLCSPFFAE